MSFYKTLSSNIWDFYPSIFSFSQSKKKRFLSVYGISNLSAKAFFMSDYVIKNKPKNIFFIIEKKSEAYEYLHLFKSFLGDLYTPIYKDDSIHPKDYEKQIFLFSNYLNSEKKHIFLLSRKQLSELYPNSKDLLLKKINLTKGVKLNINSFLKKLIKAGYKESLSKKYIEEGEFVRLGDFIKIYPLGFKNEIIIDLSFDVIEKISSKEKIFKNLEILPCGNEELDSSLPALVSNKDLFFIDEFDDLEEKIQNKILNSHAKTIENSVFPVNQEDALHLRFTSVLKFYMLGDFLNDLREKINAKWKIILVTKRFEEMKTLFLEDNIPYSLEFDKTANITLLDAEDSEFVPPSFQNPKEKILFLTDREVFNMQNSEKRSENNQDMTDFLTSLKKGDYVVHSDHGIGKFLGISKHTISNITNEYLEIEYLKNDKLFIPIAYCDKISRFITEDDKDLKLTRLGGKEWSKSKEKAKKESSIIAKDLLMLYAKREKAHAFQLDKDTEKMEEFESNFSYTPTPGQVVAIRDIKKDMESAKPMDRLVCGDVGFGKTEVAMRAAFKAVENGLQVAVIAPITILVDQHFKSFVGRMKDFSIKIEEISRFKTPLEQKKTLERLKKGKIDIIIGTHRLLSNDVKFHNLGLLIVDEEQRFGVKQKELIKNLKKNVHILTMTATPIPRTLNLALHNLRDISTITTPPPGRLPVITEVRKYSDMLIKSVIEKELDRNGQVYFLHNRVQTIESITDKLRLLIPSASFVIAHGQMNPHMLEDRINDFKNKKYDVLVSSTIIENGIDLSSANSMIINNADSFGLSQLHQLRGRIGRSNLQAYAYLLYSCDKLSFLSKKRLRAIVESSELGSGYKLSMRDLEIRGAGDVLGISQHGSVTSVGVNYFLKLLKKTLNDIEHVQKNNLSTKIEEEFESKVDIPLNAFIPSFFIPDTKEKIISYQRFAGYDNLQDVKEFALELSQEYGVLPVEVKNLVDILEIKLSAQQSFVKSVKVQDSNIELLLSNKVTAKEIMNLISTEPRWKISGNTLKIDKLYFGESFVEKIKNSLLILRGN
jgi:transcription-repair coupling factor